MLKTITFISTIALSISLQAKVLNPISTLSDGEITRVIDVAISADDNFVYAARFGRDCCTNQLLTFKRDTTNGSLEIVQTAPKSFSLNRVFELLLTKDQTNIYAIGEDLDSLSVLSRDADSGELEEIQFIRSIDMPEAKISDTTVLAESSDGQYILVSGGDFAISVFKRSATSGELDFVSVWENNTDAPLGHEIRDIEFVPGSNLFYISTSAGIAALRLNESDGKVDYLWSANGYVENELDSIKQSYEIEINPNNNNVYLASLSAIHVFNSNLTSGELSLIETHTMESLGHTESFPHKLSVENGSLYFVVGNHLNFGSNGKSEIIRFSINTESGSLTALDRVEDGVDLDLMNTPSDIAFSSDGKNAYVPAFIDGVLLQFDINNTDGNLVYKTYTNAENGVRGLDLPKDLDVTTNGQFLYVTSNVGKISTFELNQEDETLTFIESVTAGEQHTPRNYDSATLSPDEKHLYITGAGRIDLFDRSDESGLLAFSQSFTNSASWIQGFGSPTSLAISENGEYVYVTHSNSSWLVTVLSRDINTGALELIERLPNNRYGSNDGVVGRFSGAVFSKILPDNKHLIVFSNAGQLALFGINELTGELVFKQIMENTLFGDENSRINTSAIGLFGDYLYLPYQTRNEISFVVDEGIIVAELNDSKEELVQKYKYSAGDEARSWLKDGVEFVFNSSGNRAYLTKDGGDSFVAVDLSPLNGEISFIKEITPNELGMPELGQPKLVNTFLDGNYIAGIDAFNDSITLFRKNSVPELIGSNTQYDVKVGEQIIIDFSSLFFDFDEDTLLFDVEGEVPDWLTLEETTIEGTPGSTDTGTTLTVYVTDSVDPIKVNFDLNVINTPPTFTGDSTSYNANVGDQLTIDLNAIFTDIDGDTLEFQLLSSPEWITLNSNTISGTPAETDTNAEIKLNIQDGVNSIETTFNLNVISTPDSGGDNNNGGGGGSNNGGSNNGGSSNGGGGGGASGPLLLILFGLMLLYRRPARRRETQKREA